MNQKTWTAVLATFVLSVFVSGCQSGGIGDPCTPEDEYQQYFSGYSSTEVNLESRSFQCETRLCLVNHFQGRVSCPYGTTSSSGCQVPGTSGAENAIKVDVKPQLDRRLPGDTVYCSCRCNGDDPKGRYCDCPTGFQCKKLLDPVDRLGSLELAGDYCIKDGTFYEEGKTDIGSACQLSDANADPPGNCGPISGPYN